MMNDSYQKTLLLLAATLFTSAIPAMAAVTLIEIDGDVKVNEKPATRFQVLASSDLITIHSAGKATLVDSKQQKLYKLSPGQYRQSKSGDWLAKEKLTPSTATALPSKFKNLQLDPSKVAQASLQLRSADAAGQGQVKIIAPQTGSFMRGESIRVEWQAVAGASGYKLEVADATGKASFSQATTATQLDIAAMTLRSGQRYRYSVTAQLLNGATAFGWGELAVIAPDLEKQLVGARPKKDAASVEHRLYELALRAQNLQQAAALYAKEHP